MNGNGWDQSKEHVRAEMQRLSDYCQCIDRKLQELRVSVAENHGVIRADIAALKTKSGVWGLIAGALPVLVLLALEFLKGS